MMPEYNLLVESWIPVKNKDGQKNISLKELLCQSNNWQIFLNRDDMELACLQMIICMVQVIFMPKNFQELEKNYENPMKEDDYDKRMNLRLKPEPNGISFKDCFYLIHPEHPFMQTNIDLRVKKEKKSLQKLFIGLPEKTSSSGSSNAFFNRTDEVEEVDLGPAAIALFQQATNGFSLGGSQFSKGLKGSMPITTLVYEKSPDLRKTIWCNILDKKFMQDKNIVSNGQNEQPTWIDPPSFDKKRPKPAHTISLMRGLFYQPAKIQLEVSAEGKATGFSTEPGMSYINNGFWRHPHTPIKRNNKNNSPFNISAKADEPLWTQMLGFFYTQNLNEGQSRAWVVDRYAEGIGRGESINLAVGGYIKGKTPESLAERKHEMYSLKSGWGKREPDMKVLIDCALKAKKYLNESIVHLGKNLKWENSRQGQEKSNFIKKMLQDKAKQMYFNNSEAFMHETLRDLDFKKIQEYKKKFCDLAEEVFEEVTQSYEHDPKLLKAIEMGRKCLNQKLKLLKSV